MANDVNGAKPSPTEIVKETSRYLRGDIGPELARDTDHFSEFDKNLTKFHGFYQQDDRDARKNRKAGASGKSYIFMVRCKIPGGKVTAEQYLAVDGLCEKYGNGSLRVTSRQGFQFHGVRKGSLKGLIGNINKTLLTTLGACGDVNRNVMAVTAPFASPIYQELQRVANLLAAHFAPRTGAYHEIWIDGKPVDPPPENEEPIYGKAYLPRKFKIGMALPDDNSIDVFAQDLGVLGIVENGKIVGYNLLAGGSMGMTHGNPNTFPYLAQPICFVTADQIKDGAEAVIKLFRDHGNRSDRKRARLKYVVHDWGVGKFRDVLATYLPFPLVLPRDVKVDGFPLHLGWQPQGDGKYFYGIHVENGRIKDEGTLRLRTALRTLVERYQPRVRLTPMQDVILGDLPEAAQADVVATLAEHGVATRVSLMQQHSMACPALPTCGLAIAEAERALPSLIDALEVDIAELGLADAKIGVRMTGCPNGCVRPYQSDIGIVGRSGDKYSLFVGGNLVGSRLSFMLKDLVPLNDIVATLRPLLERFRDHRENGEGFGDYCHRLGEAESRELVGGSGHESPHEAQRATFQDFPVEIRS